MQALQLLFDQSEIRVLHTSMFMEQLLGLLRLPRRQVRPSSFKLENIRAARHHPVVHNRSLGFALRRISSKVIDLSKATDNTPSKITELVLRRWPARRSTTAAARSSTTTSCSWVCNCYVPKRRLRSLHPRRFH